MSMEREEERMGLDWWQGAMVCVAYYRKPH